MTLFASVAIGAQTKYDMERIQMEQLDRGVVAFRQSADSVVVSWRYLQTDPIDTEFDIYRNGKRIGHTGAKQSTTFTDYYPKQKSAKYEVVPVTASGKGRGCSWTLPQNAPVGYIELAIDKPEGFTDVNGNAVEYRANDATVADLDGDGQLEIVLKWDPSNSKDNSQDGYTGNVIIDCYTLDGTKLWRIDLGVNIRAGAHYTQFMVYDFDGDGKAEMICKTAPGSKDSKGMYVNQATTDEKIKAADNTKSWLSTTGRMNGGHEYLTVFNGLTGEAVHTIAYNPNRNATSVLSEASGSFNWAIGKTDNNGYNRGDRYLAAVAYLDGPDKNPSGIFCRGYYSYAFVWAVDFDGTQLRPKWLHSSKDSQGKSYTVTTYDADGNGSTQTFNNCKPTQTSGSGSGTMFGNGNHNMSIADVDGDGCDEIIWGSAALNNDGTMLYATGFGHGDAIHLADHCPDRPGLEVFQVHEEGGAYAWDLHDAATGEILQKRGPSGVDNGRGMAGQFDANIRGSLFWSAKDGVARSAVTGEQVSAKCGSMNFRIYWDDDLQDELLDGKQIDKWKNNNASALKTLSGGPNSTCNSTKNTPNLQADILGDWREEVILHNGADKIAIYSSNIETGYRVPTLMHDHVYRMGIAWQNTAYNQPPHLGYYLPDTMLPPGLITKELTVVQGEPFELAVESRYIKNIRIKSSATPDGTTKNSAVPEGMTRNFDTTNKILTLTGTASEEGDYQIVLTLVPYSGDNITDTVVIHSQGNPAGIETIEAQSQANLPSLIYDLQGRLRTEMRPGEIYIIRQNGKTYKVKK